MKKLIWVIILSCFLGAGCELKSIWSTGIDGIEGDLARVITEPARGCVDFMIFRHDELFTHFLVVEGITDSLLPDTTTHIFNLKNTSHLNVYLDQYDLEDGRPFRSCFLYCSDVFCQDYDEFEKVDIDTWTAEEGTIEIKRTEIIEHESGVSRNYFIEVEIKNAVFCLDDRKMYVNVLPFESVRVGWLPG